MSEPIRLPNELWIRVLQNLRADDDLPFLWITCRHVNSVFRHAVESTFQTRLLPKLRINFTLGKNPTRDSQNETNLGTGDYHPPMQSDRRSSGFPLACEFKFQSLLEDGKTAILSVYDLLEKLVPVARKRMREVVSERHIEIPSHNLQIRREVTDGPIPHLSFDGEKMEVSCDWKELFSAFYGEEFLYHSLMGAAIEARKPRLDGLKTMVAEEEMGVEQVIMRVFATFAALDKVARKTARRARIKKQWADIDPEWTFERDGDQDEETRVLKDLKQYRKLASFEEWSDDEEEEDDENADTDDEDEDAGIAEEWETDDDQEWESDAETDE